MEYDSLMVYVFQCHFLVIFQLNRLDSRFQLRRKIQTTDLNQTLDDINEHSELDRSTIVPVEVNISIYC